MFFDTHCHLNSEEFLSNIDEYMDRAKKADVQSMIVVGWDYSSSLTAIQIAEKYPNIYAAIGFHPSNVQQVPEDEYARNRALMSHEKVVAIGEIGLDYYWEKDLEAREKQKRYFIRQINEANKLKKPVVIHSRDAMKETYDILKEHRPLYGGVMHCYSGPAEMVQSFIDLGLFISLGGPVTFKNGRVPKEVAQVVPLKWLLIETDSPYLAPHPYRGKQNEVSFLPLIAEEIARIKGLDKDDIGEWTTRNAERLFHVKHNAD